MDQRTIWLKTLNGVPQTFAWAKVKTMAEEPDPVEKVRSAALGSQELQADGWDATTTAWRDVPILLYPHFMLDAAASPVLASRTLTIDGVSFDLDTAGRPCPDQEDCPPDVTITNIDALCTLVEAVGESIAFVEATTLKSVRVYTSEPGSPLGGCDSAIYRQDSDGQVVRVDA